jgi:hypothetical protein
VCLSFVVLKLPVMGERKEEKKGKMRAEKL